MLVMFMAAIESTIVATAMPTIIADLGDFHLFSCSRGCSRRKRPVKAAWRD
jgi:hypothetical protein